MALSSVSIDMLANAFKQAYLARAPFRGDQSAGTELAVETEPVIEALSYAVTSERPPDLKGFEHHEALAMVTLLGRRAAALDITPTAAIGLVSAIAEAFRRCGLPFPDTIVEPLQALCIEGYVAGRDERLGAEHARRAVDNQPVFRISRRCLAIAVSGTLEPETLSEIFDRFGRSLLNTNAAACIVEAGMLREPTAARAAELFSADVTARMIGVRCIYSGVTAEWLHAGREARIHVEYLQLEPTFDVALQEALRVCDMRIRPSGHIRRLFRRSGEEKRKGL